MISSRYRNVLLATLLGCAVAAASAEAQTVQYPPHVLHPDGRQVRPAARWVVPGAAASRYPFPEVPPAVAQTVQSPAGVLHPDARQIRPVANWVTMGAEASKYPIPEAPVAEVKDVPVPMRVPEAPPAGGAHVPSLIQPEPIELELGDRADSSQGGMTLAELEEIAFRCNPTLVQATMRIRANEARFVQAGLYPNPEITYAGVDMGLEGTEGQQGMFLSQTIITARKLRKGQAVEDRQIQQARFALQSQQLRVLNDVRSAYYDVLVLQRKVELKKNLVRLAKEGLAAAERLHKAQEVSRVDVLEALIETDEITLKLHDARDERQAAWRHLVALLGTPQMEITPLAGRLEDDLPEFTWEEALQRLLNESPLIAQAEAAVQRYRCAIVHQRSLWKPNIDLMIGQTHETLTRDRLTHAEVNMEVPIFNRNQGNIWKAQAGLIAAKKEAERVRLHLRDQLAFAFQHYTNGRQEVEVYSRQILPNARKTLELVSAGYRQGEFDYLRLLTSQQMFFRANLAYVESLGKVRSSGVAIEGMLLTGGLASPMFDEVIADEFIIGD